ncbi:Crossover junction endonuclease mus81 [Elasticomyces elasticus]|uniref:Crossover junction endonuclease MUS81 n=1 Tax=Exophiala sideris TaxID=1016849 RepID=A0ABR0J5D0_9EURO|nr:Crossover junction endonuclease mus81 [Elasticomyces elasticus]KAK5028384.1 Crossover junction endonuclease mus81 [Exophiala sideris]KAK5035973.1 Crossover junction endonuclease mus81 [Exophiala sideris]KAK5057009.1 Crossover junction endonuclease mus81 [Exophiala sideris]KAK5181416.1 Crossover junction endonuclease mus81 [Eurotiomycetes sp. CCFEE 6388]
MAETCANPLLAKWLKEWMDEAKERNSKGYTVYKKAYQSMIACPMRFNHPSEAQQLNGLGPKLCDRLADKLKAFCESNGLPMPAKGKKRKGPGDLEESAPADAEPASPKRKQRKTQPYVPKLRSGAYALVMALGDLDQETNQAIPKDELMAKAQPHSDASFYAPSDPTKFYTAWQSMKTLESKELVCTKGNPVKRYYLSDEGWEVYLRMQATLEGRTVPSPQAKRRKNAAARDPSPLKTASPEPLPNIRRAVQAIRSPPKRQVGTTAPNNPGIVDLLSSLEPAPDPKTHDHGLGNRDEASRLFAAGPTSDDLLTLPAGSFEVRMLLDTREIRTTTDREYISGELKKLGVNPELRSLPLGDVLWVAEVNPSYADALRSAHLGDDPAGKIWIVLEHVLERKRLDDLIGSIKDGRFREQKFRLHKSGVKHVVYVVEEYSLSAEKSEKYGDAVESAIASMQVVDNVFVKQTTKLDDTIRYLARMTKTLKTLYEKKDIYVIPSRSFEVDAASITLERLRRLSPEKVFGITFSVFGAMCDKSDSMSLRDVYLKMLMCTRGVTGDKAIEIQKIWPTPRALAEAFEMRKGGLDRDNMISDRLGNVIPRKKVAKALSAKIAEIWG